MPDTLEKLLKAVNAKLRTQAAASRPRVADVRKALAQVERKIANYTRAIARGDFASLESPWEPPSSAGRRSRPSGRNGMENSKPPPSA